MPVMMLAMSIFTAAAQTNSLSPATRAALSNFLSRLTNDEAKAAFKAKLAAEFPPPVLLPLHEFVGWATNGSAVYTTTRLAMTNYNNNPLFIELNRLGYPTPPLVLLAYYTNRTFHHFFYGTAHQWTDNPDLVEESASRGLAVQAARRELEHRLPDVGNERLNGA